MQDEFFDKLSLLIHSQPEKVGKEFQDLVRIDDLVVELIRNLRSKYKIGVLTNSGSAFFRSILDGHNLAELFDEIVVSSEYKIAKPDPEIFKIMLKNLQGNESEALFIDDNLSNVAAAKKLGMEAILFSNSDQLKNDLPNLGVNALSFGQR